MDQENKKKKTISEVESKLIRTRQIAYLLVGICWALCPKDNEHVKAQFEYADQVLAEVE